RMPDSMGSAGSASFGNSTYYGTRRRQSPMITAVLGQSYGLPTWNACLSDIVVMWTGASMAVSGPRVLELATGEQVSAGGLGGVRGHAEGAGFAEFAGDSDEACLDLVKQALGYLPSHAGLAPPRAEVPEGSGAEMASIADLVPESRTRAYDMRRLIARIVDGGLLFELKPRFGRAIITALTRIGGRGVGGVANQPLYQAGGCGADGRAKGIFFLCLFASLTLPLLFLHDIPGFFIGKEAERRGVPGKIINWMEALGQVTVPRISIVVRKTYGQAYFNMGGGDYSDLLLAWPTADMSFMDPDTGVNV